MNALQTVAIDWQHTGKKENGIVWTETDRAEKKEKKTNRET